MSSSAVSTCKSASARLPSPDAALSHKASNCSSGIMSRSPNAPTRVRRGAPEIAGVDAPAFSIVGIALLAAGYRKAVTLAAVHHERNGFGGLAERDRQAARGERIERAGVARAAGLEQPLHDCDRVRRSHA